MKVEKLVTFADAVLMAAKVINENPSYVYEKPGDSSSCVNWTLADEPLNENFGQRVPSCVIGHIVHQFSDLQLIGSHNSSDSGIPGAFNEHGVTRKAQAFFDYLQKQQDRMILPWSACFVKAFEYVSGVNVDDTVRAVPVN